MFNNKKTLKGKKNSIIYLSVISTYFAYMFALSFSFLIVTFLSKDVFKNSIAYIIEDKLHLLSDGYTLNNDGIIFTVCFAIAIIATIALLIYNCRYNVECVSSKATSWSIMIFASIILVVYIIFMLSSSFGNRSASLIHFVTYDSKYNVNLGNTAMSIVLFTIVAYACLIVSLSRFSISFKKYSKNNYQIVEC